MVWHQLAFLHWRVPEESLRAHIPRGLELDTFDGSAWLGIVPFRMSGIRPFGLPLPGRLGAFPELNVRTYVTAGGKPGVWFFSLDATSRLAVRTARRWFHLPYFNARMSCHPSPAGEICYASERTHAKAAPWRFQARYRPCGAIRTADALERFLVERYCLYAVNGAGELLRGDIHHVPWPLQPAEVEIETCELFVPQCAARLTATPLAHYAERLDVLSWTLSRLGT